VVVNSWDRGQKVKRLSASKRRTAEVKFHPFIQSLQGPSALLWPPLSEFKRVNFNKACIDSLCLREGRVSVSVFEEQGEDKTAMVLLFVFMFKPPFSQEAGGNTWCSGLQWTARFTVCGNDSQY